MDATNHAKIRIKERCGLPKKAIQRNIDKALQCGIKHDECTGSLKRYMDYLFLSHHCGANTRLYGDHVYIFSRTNLITVLYLPNKYKSAVNKITKRKSNQNINGE